jgi:hypothetical protein
MTKLTVFAAVAIVYLGVVKFAQFLAAVFFIVVFGVTAFSVIRNLKATRHPPGRLT